MTVDPRALSYILNNGYAFPKPPLMRRIFEGITGNGVLVAEGDNHRRQRRIVAPPFSLAQIRELTPLFLDKAYELSNIIDLQLSKDPYQEVDVLKFIAQCTFDIIGVAGFGTELGCLDPTKSSSELADAMKNLVEAHTKKPSVLVLLQTVFPVLDIIPTKRATQIKTNRAVIQRVGQEIIAKKKSEIIASRPGTEEIKKAEVGGKDLLSLIVRANIADDVSPSQKLSDDGLLGQIVTFMFAGAETSSTSVSLTLEALCDNTEIQEKLRRELLSLEDDQPSLDALNDLPYLDAVVRESLRRFPPAPLAVRAPLHDDVLPLSFPVKNNKTGEMMSEIAVKKNQPLQISTICMNTDEKLWGSDALVFNPERWLKPLPESTNEQGSMWNHIATFLAGPRSCIGYRFALAEIKSILFVLLRTYRFEHLFPKPEIYHRQTITMRPVVAGREDEGGMMPLKVVRI